MSQTPDTTENHSEASVNEMHDDHILSALGKSDSSSQKIHTQEPHEKLSKESIIVERPAQLTGTWERWLMTAGQHSELLDAEMKLPPHCQHIISLPSSSLFSWPLWVATEGECLDLVRLELSGRHLLKRGMEDSLSILPILRREDRQLVLAVAQEDPFPSELLPTGWKTATHFELPARLLVGSTNHDLILWEEWGVIQMAFYRNQHSVWFCGARQNDLAKLIHRTSLRLLAEGVLEQMPACILLEGISTEIAEPCMVTLSKIFPRAQITHTLEMSAPQLRIDSLDLPPLAARAERNRAERQKRLFSFAIVGVILYLLLLLWGAGNLFIKQTTLKQLRGEIDKVAQPSLDAQEQSSRWHTLRQVIDPNTYALDLLKAVAVPTLGGKIRLTLFSLEQGHLHLSGEAGDLSEANSAIESLKKNPLLQEYDWTASQPQLAGKNSVKFDMEGSRPDAVQKSDTTSDNSPTP